MFVAKLNGVCLIPKQTLPKSLVHFRLISLCNVIMKIISKVIANRLKPLTSTLTKSNKSRFIPHGQATISRSGTFLEEAKWYDGGLVAKIDLEKAYDMIDWEFLKQVVACSIQMII